MKQKIANYCIVLLVFVTFFCLYQAYKQNRIPVINNANESLKMTKETKYVVLKRKIVIPNNDHKLLFNNARVGSDNSEIVAFR
jgi:hypothetical protein